MGIESKFPQNNPAGIVFDPIPSYDGMWVFAVDNLIINAIQDKEQNKFLEFYNKTYKEPLTKIFETEDILDFEVKMISKPNKNNIGRCLCYSKADFVVAMTNFLNQKIDIYGLNKDENETRLSVLLSNINKSNDELNGAYSLALQEKLHRLNDLINKEINSEYYDSALEDCQNYERKINKKIDFTAYINSLYKTTSKYQRGMLKLRDFFDTPLDYNELYKAFKPDKFFLLFAKIIYDNNLFVESKTGHLDNSYGYLFQYKNALAEMMKEDKKYNVHIYFNINKRKTEYSRWPFLNDFNNMMGRHPEAKEIKLPFIEEEKYKDIEFVKKITSLYEEDTTVNWKFLPKGEKINKAPASIKEKKDLEEKKVRDFVKETNLRIAILENSGYVGTPVMGLDTFNGYYAFIYPNGIVILEKFWENEKTFKPAIENATYIMNIDNFILMSKVPKTTLIEYIRMHPDMGIKRIFHTSINNWQRNLYNEINGTYRIEDAINFINSLKTKEVPHE